MPRGQPFRHCFTHVGYHAADSMVKLQFTAGDVYTYTSVTAAAWTEIKTLWPSGTLFNFNWRRTNAVGYQIGDLTTTAETDSF